MRLLLVLAFSTVIAASASLAQTPEPAPAEQAPPAAAPAKPSHMKAKEVRAQCREEGAAQGLKGKDLKASVKECFAKARPDLAAAQVCREKGKDQGLSGPELKDFVKKCKKGEQ